MSFCVLCRAVYPKDVLSSVRIRPSGRARQRIHFSCSYTSRLRVTESLHHGIFANATWGGGGRERVFSGPECSRPGLQDGSNVLEEPSRFYCAFMRARKSFNFLSFNPAILQCTTELCKPVTKPITNRLKLDMAPSCKGMSLLFYVTQQDGNNGE